MEQSWLNALSGGFLIGLAASLLLLTYGRILGVSGIVGRIYELNTKDTFWRVMFFAGTVAGGWCASKIWPENFATILATDMLPDLAVSQYVKFCIAGLIVGFGTKMANGCTSGHGVCGIGRLSPRGLAATCIFMLFGALTVAVLGRL
jgi:uncharacterized membrane protein YedE/YeeE